MNKLALAIFIFGSIVGKAQVRLKANLAALPFAVVNVGEELQLSPNYTLQADAMLSPWWSFHGRPMLFGTAFVEGRYYLRSSFQGLYFGAHLGGGVLRATKWNYWNQAVYQKGFIYMAGAVVGYQMDLTDRLGLDFFLGGGNLQGQYHSYYLDDGGRYKLDKAIGFNKSGEWLPYRGGIMLTYKLKNL